MVLLLISVGLFGFGFVFWRAGVLLTLFMAIVEGALRKWAFPAHQDFLYVAKDIALAGAYLRFFGGRLVLHQPFIPEHPVNKPLAFLLVWGLVEMLNPALPNWKVGLLGFKSYFFYVPLVYLLAELLGSTRTLVRGAALYAALSVPVAVLAIVQFFSPLDSPIVSYLQWEESSQSARPAYVGQFPRVSGTFSYISGFAAYLYVNLLLLVGLLISQRNLGRLVRSTLLPALILGLVAVFMTGSRQPALLLLAEIPLLLALVGRPGLAVRTLVALGLMVGIVMWAFPDAVNAFWFRTTTSGDEEQRLRSLVIEPFEFLGLALPFGSGIGATHQAATFLVQPGDYHWVPTTEFEDEPGRVMLELGPVGFGLFYFAKLAFLLYFWRLQRRVLDPDLKVFAALGFLVQAGFFVMNTAFNVVASLYLWTFSGLLLLVPRLEQQERRKLAA
jgi:hypothetical protein